MAKIIQLKMHRDRRGSLVAVESLGDLPFEVKRVYYIYGVGHGIDRGGHRHHKTRQALICLRSRCTISVDDGKEKRAYLLDDPTTCLVLDAQDWHTMERFTRETILLVLASEHFDADDYIDEPYR